MFSNHVAQSFQTKRLRTEINKASTADKNVGGKLERAKGVVQRFVDEKFWHLVMKKLSLREQKQTTTVKETH